MSRDLWLKQLRIAGADTRSVEDVLTDDVPVDGLQHAGSALLRVERSDVLVAIARSLIEALGERNWIGDAELIAELEHYVDRTAPDLIALPVALDELGEALDQSAGSESFIDVTDGALWPAQLFDVDQGPADFDPASDRWLLVVGLGSRPAYETMQRFVATIEQPDLASRLADALAGSGAFRRFQTELSRHEASTRAGTGSVTMLAWVERAPGSPIVATNPIASCDDRTRPTGPLKSSLTVRFKREVRRCCGASNSSHLRCLPPLASARLVQRRRRRLHLHRMPGQRQAVHRDPRQHLGRDRRTERVKRPDRQASGSLTEGLGTVIT